LKQRLTVKKADREEIRSQEVKGKDSEGLRKVQDGT